MAFGETASRPVPLETSSADLVRLSSDATVYDDRPWHSVQ